MARVVLADVAAGLGSVDTINANFAAIAEALELLLSRSGDTPNQMEADLDLNGHTLLNTGASDDPNRVMTFSQVADYVGGLASGLVVQKLELQVATASQTVFTLTEIEYTPGTNNLAVYVEGVRKFAPSDYTETSSTTVTFSAGQSLGADVQFVTNEYLATADLPSHTHPWSQVTNVPVFTTRWPEWTEVSAKPSVFPPDTHSHGTSDITSGRLADARRGVYVQASQPSGAQVGDVWFW